MKTNFAQTNIFGGVYRKGGLVFAPSHNSLLAPIGNRIAQGTSRILPHETTKNISVLALSPDETWLIAVDVEGKSILIDFKLQTFVLGLNFKGQVSCIRFSPNNRIMAVGIGSKVDLWNFPATEAEMFLPSPLVRFRELRGSHGKITSIEWDYTSNFVLAGSEDCVTRLFATRRIYIDNAQRKYTTNKTITKDVVEEMGIGPKMEKLLQQMKEVKEEDIEGGISEDQSNDEESSEEEEDIEDIIPLNTADKILKQQQKKQRIGFRTLTFSGHRTKIVGAFFSSDSMEMYSIARDGVICVWRRSLSEKDKTIKSYSVGDGEEQKELFISSFARSSWHFVQKQYIGLGDAKITSLCFYAPQIKPFQLTPPQGSSAALFAKDTSQTPSLLFVGLSSGVLCIIHPSSLSATSILKSKPPIFVEDEKKNIFDMEIDKKKEDGKQLAESLRTGQASYQSISIARSRITSLSFSPSDEWVAVGCSKEGLLQVWDWVNEQIVLRQIGHGGVLVSGGRTFGVVRGDDSTLQAGPISSGFLTSAFEGVSCCDFSSDASLLATGANDGKVKVWQTNSGFCIATFAEHNNAIVAVRFLPRNALAAASHDGTVRLFDLKRYRTFRVLVPPSITSSSAESGSTGLINAVAGATAVSNCSLSSVVCDTSGTIIAAGCVDTTGSSGVGEASGPVGNGVALWSVQTGQLLDFLSGHSGPVSCVSFSSETTLLASGSWDGDVRVWDIFEKKGEKKGAAVLNHSSEVIAVHFSPASVVS
ncbi:MAG: putative WD repeat protein, partial [Streblomastix strix]